MGTDREGGVLKGRDMGEGETADWRRLAQTECPWRFTFSPRLGLLPRGEGGNIGVHQFIRTSRTIRGSSASLKNNTCHFFCFCYFVR
jgi:hypothetical protein